ncbi:hypothetical protein LIER_11683 [Lithospermum erythrorhizon]|uniref:Integrase catalytic domain-containing protein n=1 Tax=Lithospermum erythrorhizon TaxID=34254 RepID=A0AAV3PU19_LITER
MVKNQFGKGVKYINSDHGGEFINASFSQLLSSPGIVHQKTCPYTPQQNARVERKHQHLLQVARAMLFQSDLPKIFWGDSILAAIYVINRLPSALLN